MIVKELLDKLVNLEEIQDDQVQFFSLETNNSVNSSDFHHYDKINQISHDCDKNKAFYRKIIKGNKKIKVKTVDDLNSVLYDLLNKDDKVTYFQVYADDGDVSIEIFHECENKVSYNIIEEKEL